MDAYELEKRQFVAALFRTLFKDCTLRGKPMPEVADQFEKEWIEPFVEAAQS